MQSTQQMIGGWIESAAAETHIEALMLSDSESAQVVENLRQRYVAGTPRAWWMSMKVPCQIHNRTEVNVSTLLPELRERVYLIPEAAMKNPRVYMVQAGDIERLIDNCPGFEYSVAAIDESWLLTESDHDIFFFCRSQP